MSDEKRNLKSQLARLIALFVVVGVVQLTFAVVILTRGWDTYLFLMTMIVGMILNMITIVYSANSIMNNAGRKNPDVAL
jgi:hypothetical protein